MKRSPQFLLSASALLFLLAGCGGARQEKTTSWWQWKPADSPQVSPVSPRTFRLVEGPQRPQLRGQIGLDFGHPKVSKFVDRYQTDLRSFYQGALDRSGRYVADLAPILRREGIPEEFVYLPLIESGFRPHAVSPAQAVGLWQFIPDTGRRYGLRVDSYVDERKDPTKSTVAAARYLRDLYGMFGDWHLSLAAYNTGEGRISRILNRGNSSNFWQMSDRGELHPETRNYVPGFLAALQIAAEPHAYGFQPPPVESQEYDSVHISRSCPLSKVAEWCGTSTKALEEMNPALHRGVIPPDGYEVRVPSGTAEAIEIAYASLSDTQRKELSQRASTAGCVKRGGRLVCPGAPTARKKPSAPAKASGTNRGAPVKVAGKPAAKSAPSTKASVKKPKAKVAAAKPKAKVVSAKSAKPAKISSASRPVAKPAKVAARSTTARK